MDTSFVGGGGGGAVGKWPMALLLQVKIDENKKDPRFAPRPEAALKNRELVQLGQSS